MLCPPVRRYRMAIGPVVGTVATAVSASSACPWVAGSITVVASAIGLFPVPEFRQSGLAAAGWQAGMFMMSL